MSVSNTFIMECPVCNSKSSLRKIQRGDTTIFACSDKNDPKVGCKSVITINVDDIEYDENFDFKEKFEKITGNGKNK